MNYTIYQLHLKKYLVLDYLAATNKYKHRSRECSSKRVRVLSISIRIRYPNISVIYRKMQIHLPTGN